MINIYQLLLLLVHLRIICKADQDRKYYGGRIIGGYQVPLHQYPHQVMYNGCGGAIIDKRWVITAGHCMLDSLYKKVLVGGPHSDQSKEYEVAERHQHPLYKLVNRVPRYDYMLLKLGKDIQFYSDAQPIKLGSRGDTKVGSLVTVTGYGFIEEETENSLKILHAVKLPLITWEKCRKSYEKVNITLPRRVLCAGFDAGQKDACKGDSGGPLHNNGKLIGITSFGLGCARPGIPGVFSSIPRAKLWIKKVTKLNFRVKIKNIKNKDKKNAVKKSRRILEIKT